MRPGIGNESTNAKANGTNGSEQQMPLKRKRANVLVACNNCRARKAACSGDRPACGGCERLKVPCQYLSTTAEQTPTMARDNRINRLSNELEDYESIFRYLRFAPVDEAWRLMTFIQTDPDFSQVLAVVRGVSPLDLFVAPQLCFPQTAPRNQHSCLETDGCTCCPIDQYVSWTVATWPQPPEKIYDLFSFSL
jgi:hypothetical protein